MYCGLEIVNCQLETGNRKSIRYFATKFSNHRLRLLLWRTHFLFALQTKNSYNNDVVFDAR